MKLLRSILSTLALLCLAVPAFAQKATITLKDTLDSKMVMLENSRILVRILPDEGGRILSIVDRVGGKTYHGVPPKNLSSVNYKTEKGIDGSISCSLGAFDEKTRTYWARTVTLPSDAACIKVSTSRYNTTPQMRCFCVDSTFIQGLSVIRSGAATGSLYAFDKQSWSETFIPYSGIGVAQNVTSDLAIGVERDSKQTKVMIYPVRKTDGEIRIEASDGSLLASRKLRADAGKVVVEQFSGNLKPFRIKLSGKVVWSAAAGDASANEMELLAVAAGNPRSETYTNLAADCLRAGDGEKAEFYARKALLYGGDNITAMQILYQVKPSEKILSDILAIDPLSRFPDAERLLAGKLGAKAFWAGFHEDSCWQQYLELSMFYLSLTLKDKAGAVLAAIQDHNALTYIWFANLMKGKNMVGVAEQKPFEDIVPVREESYEPLKWACENGGTWKTRLLLSRLCQQLGKNEEALSLVLTDDADHSCYYHHRFSLTSDIYDLEKSVELDPNNWQWKRSLVLAYAAEGDYRSTQAITADFKASHPECTEAGLLHLEVLLAQKKYDMADKAAASLKYQGTPWENEARETIRQVKLALARKHLEAGLQFRAGQKLSEAQEVKGGAFERTSILSPSRLPSSEEDEIQRLLGEKKQRH